MRGSLCLNVSISVGGVGDPPLTGSRINSSFTHVRVPDHPVYSVSRSCSNLSSASSFVTGSSSFVYSIVPFDLGLAPSSSGLLYTDPGVVEDLSIRSTTHSVFPS